MAGNSEGQLGSLASAASSTVCSPPRHQAKRDVQPGTSSMDSRSGFFFLCLAGTRASSCGRIARARRRTVATRPAAASE